MSATAIIPSMSTEPIKIGVGAPLSGCSAELGREMVQAIQLAVDEANDNIGTRGTRLQTWVLDDGGDEEEGVKARKR
jgi:ABC-type branched-subunit amino acid transport system substrate-binding protein